MVNWKENGHNKVLTARGCARLEKTGDAVRTGAYQIIDGIRYECVDRPRLMITQLVRV